MIEDAARLFKVEGSGNDFVAGVGLWAERLADDPDLTRRLCDRRRGIGADGTLSLARENGATVRLVYRNADGSVGDFCANGTRCAARVAVKELGCASRLHMVTGWATIAAEVDGSTVTLELPAPDKPPRTTPIDGGDGAGPLTLHAAGVPHLVGAFEGLDELDLAKIGPPLRRHPDLGPEGANVDFYEVKDAGVVSVRTWERGVEGETLSCGSGMVAVALHVMADKGSRKLELAPRSGDLLMVEALGEPPMCPVRFTGPTRIVAEVSLAAEFFE